MKAEKGNMVKVHYKGTLSDGKVFDTSEGKDPLEFQVGVGKVIPGFDEAVMGMEKGETKTVTIPSDKAYGSRREELQKEVPRSALPKEPEPQVGMQLLMQTQQGQQIPARIAKVEDEKVFLDLNHPLAGMDLTFEFTLEDVREHTEEDDKKDDCCGSGVCKENSCDDKKEEKEGCCGGH